MSEDKEFTQICREILELGAGFEENKRLLDELKNSTDKKTTEIKEAHNFVIEAKGRIENIKTLLEDAKSEFDLNFEISKAIKAAVEADKLAVQKDKEGVERAKKDISEANGVQIDDERSYSDKTYSSEKIEEFVLGFFDNLREELSKKIDGDFGNTPYGYAQLDEDSKLDPKVIPDNIVKLNDDNKLDISVIPKDVLSKKRKFGFIKEFLDTRTQIQPYVFEFEGDDVKRKWNFYIYDNNISWSCDEKTQIPVFYIMSLRIFHNGKNVLYNTMPSFSVIPRENVFEYAIKKVHLANPTAIDPDSVFVVLEDNSLWAAGRNSHGQLGFGTNVTVSSFIKHSFFEGKEILDVALGIQEAYILCKNSDQINELYFCGTLTGEAPYTPAPELITTDVDKIFYNKWDSDKKIIFLKGNRAYMRYSWLSPEQKKLYNLAVGQEKNFVELKKINGDIFTNVKDAYLGYMFDMLLLEDNTLWVMSHYSDYIFNNDLDKSNILRIEGYSSFKLFAKNVKDLINQSINDYLIIVTNNNEVFLITNDSTSRDSLNLLYAAMKEEFLNGSSRVINLKGLKDDEAELLLTDAHFYKDKFYCIKNGAYCIFDGRTITSYPLPYLGD